MGIFGFGNSENLYFPGCYSSAFLENKIENYRRILKKLSIDFELKKDFQCCGGFLDEAGYESKFRKIAKQNSEFIENKNFKKIITNCPLCLEIFSKRYKDTLPNWNIQTEFILSTILDALKSTKYILKNYFADFIFYYDSCYLGRYSKIHDVPRELLTLLGYKVEELPKTFEETLCCGSCGNLTRTNPELSSKIAENFIKILKKKKIKKIITADPRAYKHLKENLEKLQVNEIEIIELSDLICDALNIKKE